MFVSEDNSCTEGRRWFFCSNLEISELIFDVVEKFGRIDVLINNAAGMGLKDGRVDEISFEEFNAVVATDLGGTFNMIKEALPFLMKNEKGGNIINIGSLDCYRSFLSRFASWS